MKINTGILSVLLLCTVLGSLHAQHTVRGCEQVTGLQSFWSADLSVATGGTFINRGTVEYTRVTSLVNDGGFSDRTSADCSADYGDLCQAPPDRPMSAVGSTNIFGPSVDSTTIGGSAPLRMFDVQLSRHIALDNEWQIAGTLTWSTGMIATDRSDPSHFLHFLEGSSFSDDSVTRHVDGYAGWSGDGPFTVPIGDGTKFGRAGVVGSCGTNFRAAYFSGDPAAATLPGGAPFATTSLATGLYGVSDQEYWDILGADSTVLTLHFDSSSNLAATALDLDQLVVAGWDGSQWVSLGNTGTTGTLAGTGTVSSQTVLPDDYDAFTIGFFCPPPKALCQPVTVYLDASGNGTLTATAVDSNSTAGCGIASLTLGQTGFSCVDLAGTSVQLTVVDSAGNRDSCIALVTVSDTVSPAAQCQDLTVYLDGMGQASITASDINNNSTDACGIETLVLDDSSFDCSDLSYGAQKPGSQAGIGVTVTLTVTDSSGNSSTCTADVTVLDTVSPATQCQDLTVNLDAMGNGNTTAASVDNGSTDACGIQFLTLGQTSFTSADIGQNTVTLTVTDSSGNSSTCTATLTVADILPPAMACQSATVQLDAAGQGTLTTAMVDNGTTDPGGIASLVLDQTSFGCAEVGNNTVTMVATDNYGNLDSCQVTVTVQDLVAPVANCQAVTVSLNAAGTGGTTAAAVDNGSTDACGIASLSLSQTNFDCSHVGGNTVILTVTDNNGNVSTCSSTVTVQDLVAPVANCQAVTVSLNAAGTGGTTAAAVDNGSTDACGIASLSLSQTNFDCSHVGGNTVILTVTDNNGNSSTCSSTVTVQDLVAPAMLCQPVTIQLDMAGQATLSVSQVDNGTTDACGIDTLYLSQTGFDCADLGANTVVLTATDIHGNTATCQATVTVQDKIKPVVVCKDTTIVLAGLAILDPASVLDLAASYDNCGTLQPIGVSPAQFNCINDGPNLVTLTVSDGNGNSRTCQATVTVDAPDLIVTSTPENCGEFDGTLTMTIVGGPNGGQWGYSVDAGNNYQFNPVHDNMTAGTYICVATLFGGSGCTLPPVTEVVETVSDQVVTWTGNGDGLHWGDGKNWDSGFTPYTCNDVVIPAGHTVLVSTGVHAVGRTLLVEDGSVVTMQPLATMSIIPY